MEEVPIDEKSVTASPSSKHVQLHNNKNNINYNTKRSTNWYQTKLNTQTTSILDANNRENMLNCNVIAIEEEEDDQDDD